MVQVQRSFSEDESGAGTLYVVGTPIGNLEDMTYRAVRILQTVDLIAAEEKRQTRKLLSHFEINTRMVSYHEHNKYASGPELVRLLKTGQSIALVSDAGMPVVSDPGAELVAAAVAAQITVVPIPGANAALAALVMSGLAAERFAFYGFPPRAPKLLRSWLAAVAQETATILVYASPHRLVAILTDLRSALGDDRQAMLVRELTKKHEEALRGTLGELCVWVSENSIIGEYCIVIKGLEMSTTRNGVRVEGVSSGHAPDADLPWWHALDLAAHVAYYEEKLGGNRKEAMRCVAQERGMSRRAVYQALLP
jgi:16S rRNA (cytidine1402-2'-O)-methyltransferase